MEQWTIQALRKIKEHHIRQKDVAAVMGVTPAHVSRLLNGKKRSRYAEIWINAAITTLIEGKNNERPGTSEEHSERLIMQVSGDSMAPYYKDGDVVIVHKQETAKSGDDVVIFSDETGGILRRFICTGKNIMLQAINPEYATYAYGSDEAQRPSFRLVGVVKEMRRSRTAKEVLV